MKTTVSVLLLVLAQLVAGCGSGNEQLNLEKPIPVETMAVQPSRGERIVVTAGVLTTEDEVYLSFKTGGILKRIYVKEGDPIKRNQLLAALDLTEIEATVSQAKAGFEKAHRDFERVKRLYADSVATREQYENVKTGLEVAEHQFDIAKYNREYSEIRAIGNGFILKKMASEGQMVSPGMPVLQSNGAARGHWIVKAGVSDNDWAAIQIGDQATINVDIHSGGTLRGVVTAKSSGVDPGSGTFSIDVTVQRRGNTLVASGMFAKVSITSRRSSPGWMLPHEAIMEGRGGTGFVFVPTPGNRARKIQVTVEEIAERYIRVSAGLENAKEVIVLGSPYLTDNSPITLVSEE